LIVKNLDFFNKKLRFKFMDQVAIVDEKLRAQVEKIMAEDQMDPQKLSDSLSIGANQGDVSKFNAALNGANVNINSVTNRLDQTANALSDISPDLANSIRDVRQSMPNVVYRLEDKVVQSSGTEYQSRVSDFMSSVKQQLDHMANVAAELAQKPDLSQQDLMRIQYEVMQMSVVLDVASKVGDKGSQALQTLFRDK
jgi:ABC-type transporter Mla subunit MlaD